MIEPNKLNVSFRQLAYVLITVLGFLTILYLGRPVFVPLAFAVIISLILYPVCIFLEKRNVGRMWSILWVMLAITLILAGIILLFSTKIIDIASEGSDFGDKMNEFLARITSYSNSHFGFMPNLTEEDIRSQTREWLSKKSHGMAQSVLKNSATILSGMLLTVIYTFLILLYRRGIVEGLLGFVKKEKRETYAKMIMTIQRVGQQYVTGMFLVILILGVLDSLALLLLGVDYPLFFGFMASLLAIIPYVGTTLGGAIPFTYALVNEDSLWVPVGVFFSFWFIQIVEGNFLSPKIVGGKMNLNALAAIFALICGGFLWGIPGMILSLPFAAILRVVTEHYNQLDSISSLLEDDLYKVGEERSTLDFKIRKLFK